MADTLRIFKFLEMIFMKYIFNHFIEVHSLAIMHINWFKGFKMLRKRILTFFSNILFFYHFLCRPLLFMKSVVETYYSQRKRFCGFKIKPSWAKRWCSLVEAKLWLETKKTQQQKQDVSIEIRGPLASTKEHQ